MKGYREEGQYEDYAFVLYFDELDEELQDEKIRDSILKERDENYPEDIDLEDDELVEKYYEDEKERIEAHFPMYF